MEYERHATDERRAWITLASTEGVGEMIFARLIADFGSAQAILGAAVTGGVRAWSDRRRAADQPFIPRPVLDEMESVAHDPGPRLSAIDESGLWTLTPLDEGYPSRLRDLDPPPLLIHGWGDPAALTRRRAVAVVGTRRPTAAGRVLATRLSARLTECGAVVVSGLAVGIDGAAHAAAVESEGCTVAVIGAGHRQPGPRAHTRLRDAILDGGGAIISEHHPATRARKGTYPRRNRIIAALGDATVVVEAPRRSGASITARHALELGRLVLVAPGRVGDWSTAGSLALLRETPARPLIGLDEMIEDLGYLAAQPDDLSTQAAAADQAGGRQPALAMLGPAEKSVARRLCDGPAGLDLIVADTGLAPAVVSSAVTMLLMRGWVEAIGPAYVVAGPLARAA